MSSRPGPGPDFDGSDDRALFRPIGRLGATGFRAHPTEFARGPWDHGLLHGGAVAGLAAFAAERASDPDARQLCSRLTVELLRAVPTAELAVESTVVRTGRRASVIDVSIHHGDALVARASTQWVMPSPGWPAETTAPPPRPTEVADPDSGEFVYPRPGFNCDASELRYVSGSNEESGPGTIWVRLTSPILAGSPTSPMARVATVADLAAAAGHERSPEGAAFINPDLTLQLNRYPRGEWLALEARYHRAPSDPALGFNEAFVYDDNGPFGRVLQSLVESPTQPGAR